MTDVLGGNHENGAERNGCDPSGDLRLDANEVKSKTKHGILKAAALKIMLVCPSTPEKHRIRK